MPYIPDAGFDGTVADRLKRRIFNAGLDPSAPSAGDLPIHTYDVAPVSDQSLRDIGNASVGVEPRPSLVQRLLGGLQGIARDPRTANVAAGLASVFRPTDQGAQGFLGSAADAFLNASQYTNQRAVQQREQALKDRLMEAQIRNYDSQSANRGVQGDDVAGGAFSVMHHIPGSSLGADYDPNKTYGAMFNRSGQLVGRAMEEVPVKPTTLSRMGEMTPAAQQTAVGRISNSFRQNTQDYAKAAEAWSQVNHVLERARSGTHSPDDIVQLLDGISRLNNPGAVVRTGTVQLQLQKIGSLSDKLRMYISRGATGTWPSDVIEGIASAAREIAKEHRKQYQDARRRAVNEGNVVGPKVGQQLDVGLPDVWGNTDLDVPDAPLDYTPPP